MTRTQKIQAYLAQKAQRAAVKTIADGFTIQARKIMATNDKITSTIMVASLARSAATLLMEDHSAEEAAENFRQFAHDLSPLPDAKGKP